MNREDNEVEILINATLVTDADCAELYEFVLNEDLKVTECVHVASLANGIVVPLENYASSLSKTLFELNHVRVNPRVDNTKIIKRLTKALVDTGIKVSNPPTKNSMALCFKPLGEISDIVRFYFEADTSCIFLSPSKNFKLVAVK